MRNGFTSRDLADGYGSFGDIISNLLGLLVVLVMVLFLSVGMDGEKENGAPPAEVAPMEFRSARNKGFRPWDKVFVVAHDSIMPIDFDAIVTSLIPGRGRRVAMDAYTAFLSRSADQADVDYFTLIITPDWDDYREKYPPVDDHGLDLWMEEVTGSALKEGVSCTFLVAANGMPFFSKIHSRLQAIPLKYRWQPFAGDNIYFRRDRETFRSRDFFLQ